MLPPCRLQGASEFTEDIRRHKCQLCAGTAVQKGREGEWRDSSGSGGHASGREQGPEVTSQLWGHHAYLVLSSH